MKTKKKLETSIRELEIALDRVSRDNSELQVKFKKQFSSAREVQLKLEEAKDEKDRLQGEIQDSNRMVKILSNQLEDKNLKYETLEKEKRCIESELNTKDEKIKHATAIKTELNETKRKLDAKVENLETELEESLQNLKDTENKMKKALDSASMTRKELKMEQENSSKKDNVLKKKEADIRDLKVGRIITNFYMYVFEQITEPSGTNSVFSLQMQLEETENNERRDKKVIREQLEYQVSNLNKELEDERQLKKEYSDKLKKSERKLKEMSNQQDELLKKIEDLQVCREQKYLIFKINYSFNDTEKNKNIVIT